MNEGAMKRAEAALADAHRRLAAGETEKAARALERARRGYLAAGDVVAMTRLRRLVEESYERSSVRDEPLFEQLLYATGQNLRFLTRREAAERGVPWQDPHPEIDDRRRPEMRAARAIRPRDLPRIVVFAALGVVTAGALLTGYLHVRRAAEPGPSRTIVDDAGRALLVATCKAGAISVDQTQPLAAGEAWTVRTHDTWFVVSYPDGDQIGCVPASKKFARASRAGACPTAAGCYS
jgi:hypothetical protein